MIIKPKVRGFVCITAHPEGCEAHIRDQVHYVKSQQTIAQGPKKVLILGASTGYGLATRIVSAFGGGAETFGVFFERPGAGDKPASAGWYNSVAFEKAAVEAGLKAYSVNGDAFSDACKKQVFEALRRTLGKVDCVIYSLAAPRRTDAAGNVYKSVLKPIGKSFSGKTLDTDHAKVFEITLEPAAENEVSDTIKVMGGEDWDLWIKGLAEEGLLAEKIQTIAYSYIGPEITWPIYRDGTIGRAKEHLLETAKNLNTFLEQNYKGKALVSVNKAVVTQASSAIPVVPLYLSILIKVMREKGLHEDCVQQMYRLWKGLFSNNGKLKQDSPVCVRLDDLEMRADVQSEVKKLWPNITTESLKDLADFSAYQENFLRLFGFGLKGVDYDKDVPVEISLPSEKL